MANDDHRDIVARAIRIAATEEYFTPEDVAALKKIASAIEKKNNDRTS